MPVALRVLRAFVFSPSAPFLCMRRYSWRSNERVLASGAGRDQKKQAGDRRTCVHAILRGFHFMWYDAAHFALRKFCHCVRGGAGG